MSEKFGKPIGLKAQVQKLIARMAGRWEKEGFKNHYEVDVRMVGALDDLKLTFWCYCGVYSAGRSGNRIASFIKTGTYEECMAEIELTELKEG